MAQSNILDDLDYVKSVAEAGQKAPLLGGGIGLWWGTLLCVTLFVHWMILTERAGLPEHYLSGLWLGFGVVGLVGSALLGKSLADKPGASALGNKVAAAIWRGNTIVLFLFGIAAGISAALGVNDYAVMNIMIPLAFGLYGLTAFVLSRLTDQIWLLWPALIGFGFVPLTLFILNSPSLYLVAIVGAVCTIIIPNAIHLRREPKTVKA